MSKTLRNVKNERIRKASWLGGTMGIVDKRGTVMKLEELIIASLAQTDALSKLLIEKGLITEAEYMGEAIGGEGGVKR